MRALVLLLLGLLTGCQTVPVWRVPRTVPPVIDGVLDDRVWGSAATITELRQPIVTNNVVLPGLQPTTVRVLWDPQYLYVSFECADNDVFCSGNKKHDDLLFQEDVCEVFLDGFGDGRQYVEIQVNPAGVNLDCLHIFTKRLKFTPQMRITQNVCDTDRWKLLEWEMKGLQTAARRTPTGWNVEMAIPAAAIMRRKGRELFFPTQIRANFVRYDWANGELIQQNWSPVLIGCPHISPSRMGRLNLVDTIK